MSERPILLQADHLKKWFPVRKGVFSKAAQYVKAVDDVSLVIREGETLGIVGESGCGKSTLLQIIAGQLAPSSGVIVRPDDLYYIPQHFGQYDSLTIAQALQIDHKQKALHAILAGDASIENFSILNDDWNIEERSVAALDSWGLGQFPLSYPMNLLSGGEKTRVFLAGTVSYTHLTLPTT